MKITATSGVRRGRFRAAVVLLIQRTVPVSAWRPGRRVTVSRTVLMDPMKMIAILRVPMAISGVELVPM